MKTPNECGLKFLLCCLHPQLLCSTCVVFVIELGRCRHFTPARVSTQMDTDSPPHLPISRHLAVPFLQPSHFRAWSVCGLSSLVVLREECRTECLDRLRHNDSTDLMRISADIPNISTAHKNCVEAWMADKAADMGYFDEFKDSALQ